MTYTYLKKVMFNFLDMDSKYQAISAELINLADIVDVETSSNGFKPCIKVATKWLIPHKVAAEIQILYADKSSKTISSKQDIAEVYRVKLLPVTINKSAAKEADYVYRYCVTQVRTRVTW